MTISAAEQYLIELINRARLDPVAEAARYKISLNADLAPGTLGAQVRQVLAPNEALEDAAIGHSQWMLAADVFSHTGANGTSAGQRATMAGYYWNWVGENIQWIGSTGTISLEKLISSQHEALFRSAHHRVNLLQDGYREIGVAQVDGQFTQAGRAYNAAMLTEDFGLSGQNVFVTGVAYNDVNKDNFYSMGEGAAGISLSALGVNATTEAAGGYALSLDVEGESEVEVAGTVGLLDFSATVDISHGNVKFDVVNGTTIFTSGDITLGSGLNDVRLLGAGALDATGNANANKIWGNAAANELDGANGADQIWGGAGDDKVKGGAGADIVYGELGADKLSGDAGADTVNGGLGNDSLYGGDDADKLSGDLGADLIEGGAGADVIDGGLGSDRLWGGAGSDMVTGGKDKDTFIFMNGDGNDQFVDYKVKSKEVLLLDDALWGGVVMTEAQVVSTYAHVVGGHVVFDFGDGDMLHLNAMKSLKGLAAMIDII